MKQDNILPQDAGAPASVRNQLSIKMAVGIGLITAITTLLLVVAILVLAGPVFPVPSATLSRSGPTAGKAAQDSTVNPEGKKRSATITYWHRVVQLDVAIEKSINAAFAALQSDNQTEPVNKLCALAQECERLADWWSSQIRGLPVLDVDEDLLKHVQEDIQLNLRMTEALSGMAMNAVALENWRVQRNTPKSTTEDMVDAFVQGLLGRPFAGYEKHKANLESLDAEGQQLTRSYLSCCKAFQDGLVVSEERKVADHGLRILLSSRYKEEFEPRP